MVLVWVEGNCLEICESLVEACFESAESMIFLILRLGKNQLHDEGEPRFSQDNIDIIGTDQQ
jgi:hypothetical protein